MREVEGKVAFITGAASGIGLGIARAFAEAGLKVMLADIEEDALHVALADLQGAGADVRGVVCDVSDRSAVHRAAGETLKAFGKVHILSRNNAGVLASGQMETIAPREWEWVIGVNVMGMIYGVEAFLPLIKSHGEGGHIVNTSSATAMSSAPPGAGPYTATKSAILALSETLAGELAGTAIGVSGALSRVCANPDRRERAKPPLAIWQADRGIRSGQGTCRVSGRASASRNGPGRSRAAGCDGDL